MASGTPDFVKNCAKNEGFNIFFTHIPTNKTVKFVSFLDNWEDSWTSEWNEQSVYGRMDPISTYQRTGRKISFSFKILNFDLESGKDNMSKFSELVNFQYPEYFGADATSIKTAPLIKIKFSNWTHNTGINGLLGYLAGINYTPSMEAGMLSYTGDGTTTIYHMPKEMTVNCDFTVLHTHKLGWNGTSTRGPASYPHDYPTDLTSIRSGKDSKTRGSSGGANNIVEVAEAEAKRVLRERTRRGRRRAAQFDDF